MPRWLTALVIGLVVVLLLLAGRSSRLPASTFSHARHGSVQCLQCHHDWQQSRPGQRCKGCHEGKPDLRPRLEADFHALCRGCHLDPEHAQPAPSGTKRPSPGQPPSPASRAASAQTPPVTRCSGCHGGMDSSLPIRRAPTRGSG